MLSIYRAQVQRTICHHRIKELHNSTVLLRNSNFNHVVWQPTPQVFKRSEVTRSFSSTSDKIFNVAIVGSGPSGFYTAKYLMSAFDKKKGDTRGCKIDILERLPTPYGLVRYGVAPDHPEVKNVENDFAALFQNHSERIEFWGNVPVGDPDNGVAVEELRRLYDIVVLAYGCESDRKLGIPGESNLSGILSAREFVAWYNGHPYFDHIGPKVSESLNAGDSNERNVVVIGQGNVALDCARILAKGAKGLHETDIASRALQVIGDDGVAKVSVVGRRGHVQGAFTIKELRELTKLEEEGHGTRFIVREDELELGTTPASKEELEQQGARPKVRIDKLLREAASKAFEDTGRKKEVHLRFLLSPKSFEPSEVYPSHVGSVICERTQLEGEPGQQVAAGTGQYEEIPAQLVLVSIGYKGVPLPGLEPWYDDRKGVIMNKGGKVDGASSSLGGLYVSGWLKRGPSGIIGTNIMDAKDTVLNIVKDLDPTMIPKGDSSGELLKLLRQREVKVVHWGDFQKIEEVEKKSERKRTEKQPREKLTDISELLKAAKVSL